MSRKLLIALACAVCALAQYSPPPPSGGGFAIGSAVSGGSPSSILYVDSGTNAANSATAIPFAFGPTINGLNTTPVDGIPLINTTPATTGQQQVSPRIRLTASGWGTNGSASQVGDLVLYNAPVRDGTVDNMLTMAYQEAGGGYNSFLKVGPLPGNHSAETAFYFGTVTPSSTNYSLAFLSGGDARLNSNTASHPACLAFGGGCVVDAFASNAAEIIGTLTFGGAVGLCNNSGWLGTTTSNTCPAISNATFDTANIVFEAAAVAVSTGEISLGSTTAAVSNCGSAATACMVINVAGTTRYVPYY